MYNIILLSDKVFKPMIRRNVTYVVAAVVFNGEGHVLLTQEGFHPHVGHWYLPAGRVDPGETIAVRQKGCCHITKIRQLQFWHVTVKSRKRFRSHNVY